MLGTGQGFVAGEREITFIPRKELEREKRKQEERREAKKRSKPSKLRD